MNRARVFFYVSAGFLCLALAYHFGASNAQGQAGSLVTGIAGDVGISGVDAQGHMIVMTPNGDVYARHMYSYATAGPLYSLGNFWSGSPTPDVRESWGAVKDRYRGERTQP